MSYKNRLLIFALVLFVLCDAVAWYASYRAATSPSPVQVQAQAEKAIAEAAREPTIAQSPDRFEEQVSLAGEWQYRQTGSEFGNFFDPALNTSDWRKMRIPQNWYLAGLNYHGVIWFRREFTLDESWKGRLIRLGFDGVDYYTDVWLNGKALNPPHQGYFEPFDYNVTEKVVFGGQKNVLVVRVESPFETFDNVFPGRKTLIKGIFEQSISRPGSPWRANGQELNTGGIWNAVWVRANNFVTVDSIGLQATWPKPIAEDRTAALKASLTINNHSEQPAVGQVQMVLTPKNFQGEAIRLPAQKVALESGSNTVVIDTTVPDPVLWWPWDRGNPNLYEVSVQFTLGGQVVAEKTIDFGFREITVDSTTWAWTINGQRFFPRGTNYISSIWLAQSTPERLRNDVDLMRQANLNFVRLPAHVEPEAFYQAADAAGILVWQEFPLQWGYTDAPTFADETQRQFRSMLRLLGNHPSVAIWCAHNESPWATDAIRSKAPNPDSRQNKQMDTLLQELGAQLDPTRFTQINSGSGDQHVYPGWMNGSWKDYLDLPGAPLISEYGAGSLPDLAMMQKMFDLEELLYQSGETDTRWEFHGFSSIQHLDMTGLEYQKPAEGEDPLPALETLIRGSQDYQANLIKYATENYRRAKFSKVQGIFQYLFADPWPSIGFSVLDADRQPKASYAALQAAMQPVLPSVNATLPKSLNGEYWAYDRINRVGMGLHIVNDTPKTYPNAVLSYVIKSVDGQAIDSKEFKVNVPPDSTGIYQLIRNLDLQAGRYDLELTVTDESGHRLGSNTFKFEVLPALQPTPTPTPQP